MGNGWSALDLELPGQLEDDVLAALGSACLGAEYRPTSPGQGRLVAYFPTALEADSCSVSGVNLLEKNTTTR